MKMHRYRVLGKWNDGSEVYFCETNIAEYFHIYFIFLGRKFEKSTKSA